MFPFAAVALRATSFVRAVGVPRLKFGAVPPGGGGGVPRSKLGAPTMQDAIDLTKEELSRKATEQQIPGRSSMSKEELAATVDPR